MLKPEFIRLKMMRILRTQEAITWTVLDFIAYMIFDSVSRQEKSFSVVEWAIINLCVGKGSSKDLGLNRF